MSETTELETLLSMVDSTVNDVLEYFAGSGATNNARIGDWGAWEIMAHLVFWHEATADGMESAARGYGPYTVLHETDATNEEAIKRADGHSIHELVSRAREVQLSLKTSARQLHELDIVVMERPEAPDGMTSRQRLERILHHWKSHTDALKALG